MVVVVMVGQGLFVDLVGVLNVKLTFKLWARKKGVSTTIIYTEDLVESTDQTEKPNCPQSFLCPFKNNPRSISSHARWITPRINDVRAPTLHDSHTACDGPQPRLQFCYSVHILLHESIPGADHGTAEVRSWGCLLHRRRARNLESGSSGMYEYH